MYNRMRHTVSVNSEIIECDSKGNGIPRDLNVTTSYVTPAAIRHHPLERNNIPLSLQRQHNPRNPRVNTKHHPREPSCIISPGGKLRVNNNPVSTSTLLVKRNPKISKREHNKGESWRGILKGHPTEEFRRGP